MQVPCSLNLKLISISFSSTPSGEVRFSLERGEKLMCSKIYKCVQNTSIDQLLQIKTTLKQIAAGKYQKKHACFRMFFRDSEKQVTKHKQEFQITNYTISKAKESELGVVIPGIKARIKYSIDVILQYLPKRLSLELSLNQKILLQNNFLTNGTISSTISEGSAKQNTELISSLKFKIRQLETEISILKQQLILEKQMNTERYTEEEQSYSCDNKKCYMEKQKLLNTLSQTNTPPSMIEIEKLKAVEITHLQTISKLKQELEQSMKFQSLNKNLQIDLSNLKQKFWAMEKELKESKRMVVVRIEEKQEMRTLFQQAESDLIKTKLVVMKLWNQIQQKGGIELFDRISADVIE